MTEREKITGEIIDILLDKITKVEIQQKKHGGNGFVLATKKLDYCIVQAGKGINGTNVEVNMNNPFVFKSEESARYYQKTIKAEDGNGEIIFQIWLAADYWKGLIEENLKHIKTLRNHDS